MTIEIMDAALTSTLLAAFLGGLWVASRSRGPICRPNTTERFFSDASAEGAKTADNIVQSVRGQRYKIDVVDATEPHGMGRCLVLDGRRQFCQSDQHKYDEMLVHFPCAFLGTDRPKQALVVHGGDCGALREVLKYGVDTLQRIVVIEEDERIVEMCERHLDARPLRNSGDRRVVWMTGAPADEAIAKLTNQPDNLQAFDLIVIDGKDRPGGQISQASARNLKLLLAPEGVVSCGGGPACASSAATMESLFPHKLAFSFFSDTHDAQIRLQSYARFDLAATKIDGEAHAQRVGMRFFDATDVWSYVPWFLRANKKAAQ